MFWFAYHDVTDSRQVYHSTGSLIDYSTFTFLYLRTYFSGIAFHEC
jgi:hypothetical protein